MTLETPIVVGTGGWMMHAIRTVVRLHPAARDDIADLVTRRPLPAPELDHLGAFLFLNHHGPQIYGPGNNGMPFGPHPHRGFETGRDVFLYVARGEVPVGGTKVPAFNLAELSEGEAVAIAATADAVLVFGHAAPIGEPIVAHGPFVMNPAEEIRQAYADCRAGRFGVPG